MKHGPGAVLDRQLNFLVTVNVLVLLAGVSIAGVSFVSVDNLQSMSAQIPELGLLAIGVAITMVSGNGGIDLSGIAVANLSGIVAALTVPHWVRRTTIRWSSLSCSPEYASASAWSAD